MRYLHELELKGRRVLMRVDFNCPLTESGRVADDNRMVQALPSVKHVLEQGGRLVLCSHLGRPKGERRPEFSLAPVAAHLSHLLGRDVPLAPDCVGPEVEEMARKVEPGGLLLLENLRFHKGETANDPEFAKGLAALGEVYVNDAFAVSHRAHASVAGVPPLMEECGAGFLLEKELDYFHRVMGSPERPMAAILGGAKVSSKLGVIRSLLDRADKIVIGGAMANTFLKAQGMPVGRSLVEEELLDTARSIMDEARERGVIIYLPVDGVVSTSTDPQGRVRICPIQEVADDEMILDIGQATISLFKEAIHDARTVVWNGPMGLFEKVPFSTGTISLARAVAGCPGLTVVGGGDTGLAIQMAGEAPQISYISTGGGAFLALLEGQELPGVRALDECGGGRP